MANKDAEEAAKRAALERQQRTERQKATTRHYFEHPHGRAQMREAVRGEEASRPDGKIVSHGFNAESGRPTKQQELEQRQRWEKARKAGELRQERDKQRRQEADKEARRQAAQKEKGKAVQAFEKASKDRDGRGGR